MKFDIEWLAENDPNQRTSVFYCEGYYHSPVCIIKGNTRKVLISCDGEMSIAYKGNIINDFWDLIANNIKTDANLKKIDHDSYEANPWFNAYDITNNYDPTIGHESYNDLEITHDNLDEIVSLVKNYLMEGYFDE